MPETAKYNDMPFPSVAETNTGDGLSKEAGGENENFIGWGPEDYEHVKRMEVLGLPVHYANGPLFHLWHPRGKNSWHANREVEMHNRRVLLDTCRVSNNNIKG